MTIEQNTFDRIKSLVDSGDMDDHMKDKLVFLALEEINDGIKALNCEVKEMRVADKARLENTEKKFAQVHQEMSEMREDVNELKVQVERVRKENILCWIRENKKASLAIGLSIVVALYLFIGLSNQYELQEILDFLSNFIL